MRSYKAARRAATLEPVEFEIEYVDVVAGEEVEKVERFACRGRLSSLVLSSFAASADQPAATPEGMRVLHDTFKAMFGDAAEYRRFSDFAAKHLDDDQLVDIIGDLVNDFTGRPTVQPEPSSPSSSMTGLGSKAASLPGGFSFQAEPLSSSSSTDATS